MEWKNPGISFTDTHPNYTQAYTESWEGDHTEPRINKGEQSLRHPQRTAKAGWHTTAFPTGKSSVGETVGKAGRKR